MPNTYPKEIEIPLTLKILVNNAEEESAYLEVSTEITGADKTVVQLNTPTKEFLVDVFDSFVPYDSEKLVAVNGLTNTQLFD